MSGIKGQKWKEKKSKYPVKKNTSLSEKTGKKVEKKAAELSISESAVIRQAVEKQYH